MGFDYHGSLKDQDRMSFTLIITTENKNGKSIGQTVDIKHDMSQVEVDQLCLDALHRLQKLYGESIVDNDKESGGNGGN
jgi:hypothetical protein